MSKDKKEKSEKVKKKIGVPSALLTLAIMIGTMLFSVAVLGKEPHIPLMIGTATAIIVTMFHGYDFEEVEEMMYKGIRHALPAIVIILVVLKVPAIPAICAGVILGFFSQIFIQGDSLTDALTALQTGYSIHTDNHMVNELFNRGGLEDMFYTISLTLVAMTFGGVLEYSGMLAALINVILKFAKRTGSLIASVIVSCIGTNFTCSEQYISIIVPSRMFADAFKLKKLHAKNLSRALEDGGTLTSVFVPWNTCGVFIATTLGVSAGTYAPFAILNYIVPVISIIYGYTGFKIVKDKTAKVENPEGLEEHLETK